MPGDPFDYTQYLPRPLKRLFGRFRSHVHGRAEWMTDKEIRQRYSPTANSGIFLSDSIRLSAKSSFTNSLTMAPTGKGKTSGLVMRNVLDCDPGASIVVTDLKGSIHRATSGWMKERGYDVVLFQPDRLDQTTFFNPFSAFQTPDGLLRTTQRLLPGSANEKAFWTNSPRVMTYLCLRAIKESGEELTMTALCHRLHQFFGDRESLRAFMERHLRPADGYLYEVLVSLLESDEETLSNVLATITAELWLWMDPNVRALTETTTLDLEGLRRKPTIIYVIVPVEKQAYYAKLLNLFYSTCFEVLKRTPGRPVHFWLDEFGNLGRIHEFESFCTTSREYEISLNLLVQNVAQIEELYGQRTAQAIMDGGMQSKIFFGGLNVSVTKQVEERLGYTTRYDNEFNGSDQWSRHVKVPLLQAHEICQLPDDQVILVEGSNKPVRVELTPYYRDPRLARLAEMDPYFPPPPQPRESATEETEQIEKPKGGSAPMELLLAMQHARSRLNAALPFWVFSVDELVLPAWSLGPTLPHPGQLQLFPQAASSRGFEGLARSPGRRSDAPEFSIFLPAVSSGETSFDPERVEPPRRSPLL